MVSEVHYVKAAGDLRDSMRQIGQDARVPAACAIRTTIAAVACMLASSRAGAQPAASCAREAAELRAHLTIAVRNAHRWNLGWAIGFGGAAAAQFGLALAHEKPLGTFDRDYEETLYVGGFKATLASAARFILPLRAELPDPVSDPCQDRAALRAAIEDVARGERKLFWLTHVGAIAVNLAGGIVLAERRSWSVGAVSFALGYPVGLLSIYTMPRASWHLVQQPTWSVTALRREDGWSLGIAGTF